MEKFTLGYLLGFGALCGTSGYWAGVLLTKFEILCAVARCSL